MANSLMDSVISSLGPQILGPLASHLGLNSDTVQQGLQSGSAAILSSLASKANEPGFLGQIFKLVTNPDNTQGAISDLVSKIGPALSGSAPSSLLDLGSTLLSSVFGSRLSAVTDAIGQSAGIGSSKAGMLMSMAGSLVLGALGHHVSANNLSVGDLANTLKTEAAGLARFMPTGLASTLSSAAGAAAKIPAAAESAGNRWLWPIVILLLILAALWFFLNRGGSVKEAVHSTASTVASTVSSATTALGEFFKTTLPSGIELNIPQNGIENKLIQFITDQSKPVDDKTWFNFDRLLFDSGKMQLQPSSQDQLKNIAEILKAYPNVHVKIGGYTDNTGDAKTNLDLSAARAKSVMDTLVGLGIDPSRLSSEGYGEQFPVADNSTVAGRELNRRIALRVTEK